MALAAKRGDVIVPSPETLAKRFTPKRAARYCVMKVRGEEQSTRVSSTFLDNNNPPFMEFYHFGCQPHNAAIDFQCFDWDRRQDHEVVFTGETLRAWPASNEQFRSVWKSTTGLGGPHQTSELSISVKSN